jgi:hypothetical protein
VEGTRDARVRDRRPRGQITAVERNPRRYRSYSVEMLTEDPSRVEEALADVAGTLADDGARFLQGPHVVERRELGDETTLVLARAEVPPLDDGAVRRYRRTVLFR